MNKIKVAFVSATTRKGGAERMLFNIMNTLDDRHEIQLYITSKDVVPSFVANKFRVVRFGKKHAKAALWQLLLNLKKSHPYRRILRFLFVVPYRRLRYIITH